MDLDRVLLVIADRPISLGEILLAGAAAAFLLLIVCVILVWRAGRQGRADTRRADELEVRLVEMGAQLRAFADQTQSGQAHFARALDERLDQVSHRVGLGLSDQAERTAQSLQSLYERLAVIDRAQANLAQLSSEMVSLKDILANKQARGAYGQARMEAIVRDGLPRSSYAFQEALSNGMRPDCLIRLPESELRLVIDAKFPLEAFTLVKAAESDPERRQAEARVRKDVLHHVRDMARKYLIAGETHETAILFVPAESIHAELHEGFEDVVQRAHRERVILASPNILMLLVQTLQAIVKDAAMREQAGLIRLEVVRLLEDVGRMKERVLDLQRHFGQASGDLDKLGTSADKISKRAMKIEQLDLDDGVPAEIARPLPKPRLVGGAES